MTELRWFICFRRVLLACVLAYLTVQTTAFGQSSPKVWVNLKSGIYHCPSSQHYGKTVRGQFLDEISAVKAGYRPVAGKACTIESNAPIGGGSKAIRPLAAAEALAEPSVPSSASRQCKLKDVVDADTIDCLGIGKVRLIGIDAPEISQRPFGQQAKTALAKIIPANSAILLESDQSERDRYGRLLAYAWFNGRMLNLQLVRDGWAIAYRYPPDVRHSLLLERAQVSARNEKRGLWAAGAFQCVPERHRRREC